MTEGVITDFVAGSNHSTGYLMMPFKVFANQEEGC